MIVQANYSATGKQCHVTVLEIDGDQYYIRYASGYTEWLPRFAFEL